MTGRARALAVATAAALATSALVGVLVGPRTTDRPPSPDPVDPRPTAAIPAEPPAAISPPAQSPAPKPSDPEIAIRKPLPAETTVRDVTPPGVTPPPPVTGPLERVAPPPKPVKPAGPPKPRMLRPVLVEEAGRLRAGDLVIRLPEIDAPEADRVCRDAKGRDWPCGQRAVQALRTHIRGRGVHCIVPKDMREGEVISACRVGDDDLGHWLVRHGWAWRRPDAGHLAEAESEARTAKRGLWQEDVPPIEPLPEFRAPVLPPPSAGIPP